MSPQKEDFLKSLPSNVSQKIKKLQFADNLVLTKQQRGYVTEVKSGKEVKEADWSYTMKDLSAKLGVSLPWLYANLRDSVRYVYISSFNLIAQSFFYDKTIDELEQFHELSSIHLNNEDIFRWFNNHFSYGIRSIVIPAEKIFGENASVAVKRMTTGFINGNKDDMWYDVEKLVRDQKLWNLCKSSPVFRKTSKYPIISLTSPLKSADNFKNTTFHTLSEYDYTSMGMNELLANGAGIYKAKSGKNSKMLFTFNAKQAFDVMTLQDQMYKIFKDDYKPRYIDQGIQSTINFFAVPAVKYFKLYPKHNNE